MATFLYSVVAVAVLQAVGSPQGTPDTLRPRSDSAATTLALARDYLARWEAARAHPTDTVALRLARDAADDALAQAAAAFGSAGSSAAGDSARVLRVSEWSTRALDAWSVRGLAAGLNVWGPLPTDLRLTPVLEELGENLLRTCPEGGVLLTSPGTDFLAAWYMRFARGLRPDLIVTPLAIWEQDGPFRARMARELHLGGRPDGRRVLEALAGRRPVCASMGLEAPPGHLHWRASPMAWVTGSHQDSGVSAQDFVFAALSESVADGDPWATSALAVYTRAARATPALCPALATFQVPGQPSRCRR